MERIETTLNVESKDPLEEEVRKIFEWSSEDGLGEHNFFRIVTDNFSESLKQLFLEKRYQIFTSMMLMRQLRKNVYKDFL